MIFPFENVTCTWTAPQRVWMAVPVYVAVALETVVADVPPVPAAAVVPDVVLVLAGVVVAQAVAPPGAATVDASATPEASGVLKLPSRTRARAVRLRTTAPRRGSIGWNLGGRIRSRADLRAPRWRAEPFDWLNEMRGPDRPETSGEDQRLRASSPGIPRAASTPANPSRSSTVT